MKIIKNKICIGMVLTFALVLLGRHELNAQDTVSPVADTASAQAQGDATVEGQGPLVVAHYKGMISPVTVRYFERAMKETWDSKAQALVLTLDTPGGMMEPMRDIIQEMLSASYPVIVYVGPAGARAASAGTFIVLAADVAAMARNTNLGAAHPVNSKGEALSDKITNDATAYIMTLAERKGRNVEWAEKAVRHSVAVGEVEALRLGVVDLIADNDEQLLERLHGRLVKKEENSFLLKTRGAALIDLEMNWVEKFLLMLADPNVAYVLFLVGFYGLIFEVKTAGFGVGGIFGVLCLTLAFTSFGTLPIDYGGLALLSFGIVLFIAEAFVMSGGILGVGGAVVMLFGSFLLFGGDYELYRVSLWVMILMVGTSAGVFLWLIGDAVKVLKRQVVSGKETLIGHKGVVLTDIAPLGIVHADGEDWSAICAEGTIAAQSQVKVVGIKGLKLVVELIAMKKKEKKEEVKNAEKKSEKKEIDIDL